MGDEGWIRQAKSCFVYIKAENFMQHIHGIIPLLFDCWADPAVHLLLLKSYMPSSKIAHLRLLGAERRELSPSLSALCFCSLQFAAKRLVDM